MTKRVRTEWKGRAQFAEYAEAIGVGTDEIMAVQRPGDDGMIRVLYTTGTENLDRATVHLALLGRQDDDVLFVDQTRYVQTLRGWLRKMGLDEMT